MEIAKSKRSIAIRRFLLNGVKAKNSHLIQDAVDAFKISRQSVNNHLADLVKKGFLISEGNTRSRVYKLGPNRWQQIILSLKGLDEFDVYSRDLNYTFSDLPKNIENICSYGFTEMLNNAVDHSGGQDVGIRVERTKESIRISIVDDGEGIFNHIKRVIGLGDVREAILELSKGKLTTDPDNHTGQGIFFSSRAFDNFWIFSGELIFTHDDKKNIDFLTHDAVNNTGTTVIMEIAMNSSKDLVNTFKDFCENDNEYNFYKTVVPLKLALYEGGNLISRSQAKRILNRVEKFQNVVLDFKDIEFVGQAFLDEVFRVFPQRNKHVKFSTFNVNEDIKKMINSAIHNK